MEASGGCDITRLSVCGEASAYGIDLWGCPYILILSAGRGVVDIQKIRNPEIQEFGDSEIQNFRNSKIRKFVDSEIRNSEIRRRPILEPFWCLVVSSCTVVSNSLKGTQDRLLHGL